MAMRRLFGLLFAGALLAVALTGCNTVEGMGQDLQSLGRNMERNAEKHD